MNSCPNVNSPAWKNLVGTLNEDIAWKTYIKTKGEIVTPLEGSLLTMVDQSPSEVSSLLNSYLPDSYKKGITPATSVMDLIRATTSDIYQDDIFKRWVIRNGFGEKLGLVEGAPKRIDEDRIREIFETNQDIAFAAYQGLSKTRPKGAQAYRTKDYPLYLRLESFLKKLNFEVKTVEELQSWTGYNAMAATDLLYKTVLIANSESPTDLLLKETAYVAYSFMGKKNKIRTDLVHSVENMDNFQEIFDEYKKRSPNLYDYKIKELIVIDFIADAIKNEFEVPSESYINRKAEYWGIKGNSKLIRKLKYILLRIKGYVTKLFKLGKLDNTEMKALLKDIAHDVLVNNFQKYGSELSPDQQLTNYERTIASDPKAEEIVKNLQKMGAILTGSLSLRRLGTLYRPLGEDLHDIDFSVYNDKIREEIDRMIQIDLDPSFFYMDDEQKDAYLELAENRAYAKAFEDLNNLSIIKEIKKIYPEFKLVTSFAGLKPGERTLTGKIGNYVIDLFLVNDNNLDSQEKGFQDWEPIFIAKIRMGRAKDMRDFANYVPFNTNKQYLAQTKGFRHFNFINNNLGEARPENVYDVQARSLYADYRKTTNIPEGSKEDAMAFRQYLKLDGQLQNKRPSQYIMEDLNKHIADALQEETLDYTVPKEFYDIQNKQRALEIAYKWADKLSAATGIANERISAKIAEEMLAKTATPYNGEPAFFFNGKVYLVEDNISLNNVFHEFAHPVVQMIAQTNPGLFNSLYTQLQMTKEGQAIIELVKQQYPNLKEGSSRFMEEAIVTAMGNAAEIKANENKVNNQSEPASTGFAKFIKELLAAVKKLFRSAFKTTDKKVNLDKLSVDTTLDELAEMLTSKDFVIEQNRVTEEDIAMFAKINKEQIEEMSKAIDNDAKRKALQFAINEFFDKVRKSINQVGRAEYKGIREELVSESGGGLLNKIARQLDGYSTRTDNVDEKRQKLNELRDVQTQLQAMVNSVSTLKVVVERLDKALREIDEAKSPDYKSDLNTVSYYKHLMNSWGEFIDEGLKTLAEAGLPSNSPLVQELTTVRESMDRANDHIYNIQKRSSGDMIYDTLMFMQDNMRREHLRRMEELRKKMDNASEDKKKLILDTMQKEDDNFKKYEITKEKIQAILSGEVEDLGWWEKELLGIMNIDDPVVGAFGLFIKDVYQQARRKAEDLNVEFIRDIRPNLEAVGYNAANVGKFWDEYLFEDTTFEYDANGLLVEKKVITFLNPLKDYRYAKRKMYADFQLLKETGTKEEIAKKAKDIRNHERKYFHQKYKSEFYEADGIFDEPLGDEAWLEREMILDEIRRESGRSMTEFEEYMDHDSNTIMWRKYNQLYSLSYADGTPKKGDDLAKAQLLRRHRESTKKFYEWVPIKDGFQTALDNFVSQLKVSGLKDEEITEMVYGEKGWLRKNTKTAYEAKWYEDRIAILDRIRDITTKLRERVKSPEYRRKLEDAGIDMKDIEALDVSDQYTYIIDLVTGFRNEDGQPQGSDMGEQRLKRMFDLQKQIVAAQENLSIFTGLSVDDMETFAKLRDKQDDGKELTAQEEEIYEALVKKKGALPVSGLELAALKGLYAELNNIQFREATDNYLDVMNVFMKVVGGPALDKTNANDMLETDVVNPLLGKNEQFKEWFLKNHIKKEYYSEKEGKKVSKYERLYAWSVVRPNNEKYIKKFTVKDPISGNDIQVLGEPSNKYSFRRVKNEYRTIPVGLTPEQRQNYVGVIIDNMGNYLPKSRTSEVMNPLTGKMDKVETAPDDTYINEAYYNLKSSDPEKFELLDKVRNWHLKFQFGLTKDSKLYMDIPRFRQENLEAMQSGQYVKQRTERLRKVGAGVMAWATRKGSDKANIASEEADDYQEGLANAQLKEMEEVPLLRFMQFSLDDEEGSDRIPIHGTADIPLENTSKDVLQSMSRYMLSAEQQKALTEVNPMIKGLKDVINDPRSMPKDLTRASITHKEERNMMKYKDKKGDRNRRRDLINYLYNREFKGQIYGDEEHLQWFNKFTSMLMKGASFSFFAMNIPSAVKNYWGFLWQQTLEGLAGTGYEKQVEDFLAPTAFNPYSMGEGKVWAKYAMMQWTSNLYGVEKAAEVPLNLQIIRKFDAIQGKREEKFGTEASRSFLKDMASFTVFFSPRRFLEVEAGLQLFGAMMHHQQVEIEENGQKRFINYIDAWEMDADGKMKLKDGIDKGWDMGGEKFKAFVNRVHETSNQLAGAFSKFDKPAAQRNFAYRLWAFMRSWMIPMFMARWSPERYNFGTANTYEGWYITFGKFLGKLFTTFGKYAPLMSAKERAAIFKVLTDFALITICWFIKSILFDFDDDDEDRFKKIRQWREDEPLASWLGVHLLKLTMGTANENTAFIPWFNYGLDDYVNTTNISSIALGPTIKTYGTILQDIFYAAAGSKKARYQREVGPYAWQEKQDLKLWNHAAKVFGFTGGDWEPAVGLQSFSTTENKFK